MKASKNGSRPHINQLDSTLPPKVIFAGVGEGDVIPVDVPVRELEPFAVWGEEGDRRGLVLGAGRQVYRVSFDDRGAILALIPTESREAFDMLAEAFTLDPTDEGGVDVSTTDLGLFLQSMAAQLKGGAR